MSGMDLSTNDVFFFTQLISICEKSQDYKSKEWGWLHDFCNFIASGKTKTIGGLYNLNRNHWISIVIDGSQDVILVGDSLHSNANALVIGAISWWTHRHTNRHFRTGTLPITMQMDTFSCGLLSFNSLAHFYREESSPLIGARDVAIERIKIFLRIVARHNAFVRKFAYLSLVTKFIHLGFPNS